VVPPIWTVRPDSVSDLGYGRLMPSITRSPVRATTQSEVEKRLLAATQKLLGDGARFTELSVGALAEAAGVARSSFYAHFSDKTQLLRRCAAELGESAFGLLVDWDPSADTALDDLTTALSAVLTFYREHAPLLGAVLEVASYDEQTRQFWDAQLDVFVDRAGTALRQEQEAGRAPRSVDVDISSRIFIHGGMHAITQQVLTGSAEHDAAVARELSERQWFGSFRRPPREA
jgi:AcrR family transcriptional regulator